MKCPKCKAENPDDNQFCGKCGTPLIDIPSTPTEAPTKTEIAPQKSALDFIPGQHFGKRYQIIEEIGRGGMGRVYKAIDNELDRIVALKMIKPEISSQPGMVERFKKEIKLASQITHKNVCRIHDLGEVKGIRFISMQYIEGQDLKKLMQQTGKLTVEKAIAISKQICAALQAAHDEGVIHRDLKPQNIMLDSKGNAYVMDFGIAKSFEAEELTKEGAVVGTPQYMSPQQAEGSKVDHRSDIYSLGAIMYEMLTGNPPFTADSNIGIIHKHITEAPEPPSKQNPQIPEVLENIILKCLEKKPEERYQKTDEIIEAITEIKSKKIAEVKSTTIQKDSIAVLPFADMSPQKDQEYFCEGISEELINALTKVEGLLVASRTSAFQFKGKGYNVHEIGTELNVQTVLEGSVRKAGNRLRIAAQLINVEDGYHIWSEKYDRDLDDVFAIQDEISLEIVKKLKVELGTKEKVSLEKRYTKDFEAYSLYLRGRYYWNKRTPAGFQKGLKYLKEAIDKDPTYALAYTGIADCYNMLGYYDFLPPKEAFSKAKAAVEKALELDNTLAEAHTSLAWIKMFYDWDWYATEREFKQAINLNPFYAVAHQWYAVYLSIMGKHKEGISEVKRAQELEPLSLMISTSLGGLFWNARDHDKAIDQLLKTLEMDPNYAYAYCYIALPYADKGMHNEAIENTNKGMDLLEAPTSQRILWLGYYYSKAGNRAKAKEILNELLNISKKTYVPPLLIAAIYGELSQMDNAFKWLENAYEVRDHWLTYLKIWPPIDSLRSDPRFKALLKKMNLE
jgi:serine/threonine protein kinase/Tfp pilus assembly protein PilF